MKFNQIVNRIGRFAVKRSPEILVIMGTAGLISAVPMAIAATTKAIKIIEHEREELGLDENDELTKKEIVACTWKTYVPTVATMVLSTVCIAGSSSINFRRNAALATAYTLSESALREYQTKVIETIGAPEERKIREQVAREKVNPNADHERVVVISGGDVLCLDTLSGQYFQNNPDSIQRAINELNHTMLNEMYITLNDYNNVLGLKTTSIGDARGWHIDNGLMEVMFTTELTPDNKPCLVIDHYVRPQEI